MSQPQQYDVLILGRQGGKQLAWHLARSGKSVAVVERPWVNRYAGRAKLRQDPGPRFVMLPFMECGEAQGGNPRFQ